MSDRPALDSAAPRGGECMVGDPVGTRGRPPAAAAGGQPEPDADLPAAGAAARVPGPRRRLLALLALACLVLHFSGQPWQAGLAVGVWLAAFFGLAPARARHRFLRWKFWLVTSLIVLCSGLVLGQPDLLLGPLALSSSGLAAGALMLSRGALLFAVTTWLAASFGRGELLAVARRLGHERLGLAVGSALALLPQMGEQLGRALQGRSRQQLLVPGALGAVLIEIVVATAQTAEQLVQEQASDALDHPARGDPEAAPQGARP